MNSTEERTDVLDFEELGYLHAMSVVSQVLGLPSRSLAGWPQATSFGGKRDLYDAFGYPRELTNTHFWEMYKRGGIARRIVSLAPYYTWKEPPHVATPTLDPPRILKVPIERTTTSVAFGHTHTRAAEDTERTATRRLCV